MILVFVLTMISDIAFYMIFANFITHAEFGSGVVTLVPLIVMSVVATFSYLLNNIRPVLRFLPILLLPICFYWTQNTGAFLLLLLPCIYLSINISEKNFTFSMDRLRQKILFCMKTSFLPLVAIVFMGYEYLISVHYFYFLFIYFFCAIYIMRVTRADEKTISNPKFIMINLATVTGSLVLLSGLGAPQVMRVVMQIIGFIYFNLVLHGLMFAINVIILLLSLIGFDRFVENLRNADFVNQGAEGAAGFNGYPLDVSGAEMHPFLGLYVIQWVFVIILIAAAIFILKKLINKQGQNYASKGILSLSSSISEESQRGKQQSIFAPKNPRLAIRYYYRKFLKICLEKGCPALKGDTSEDINKNNRNNFSLENIGRLRELYIKARYSEHAINNSESKEARDLVKRL